MQEDQKVREEFIYLFIFIFMYILQAEFVLDFDNSWRLISAQVKLNFHYIFFQVKQCHSCQLKFTKTNLTIKVLPKVLLQHSV